MNAVLAPSRSDSAAAAAKAIPEHIVEVISDSGEGAQRCGQSLAAIAARTRRLTAGLRSRRSRRSRFTSIRPTARQPKKRFTRSMITPERCWISSATGPSTRSTRGHGPTYDAAPAPACLRRRRHLGPLHAPRQGRGDAAARIVGRA